MYLLIKDLDLGNLSEIIDIPKFYVKCLLQYIIQISRAISHAHRHNLVHGSFDLTKVII